MGLIADNWEFLGTVGAFFFIVANAYYPAKVIARNYLPRSRDVGKFFKRYLKIHTLFNLLGLWVVLFHGHFADERNIILQASILVTLWLMIVGMLMHYRFPSGSIRQLRLLHTQQLIFFVWIALITVGHGVL